MRDQTPAGIISVCFPRQVPNDANYEKHFTTDYPYLDTNSSKVLASNLWNASAIKTGDTYEAKLPAKSVVLNLPYFAIGRFGFGHCPVEFPSDTDSKWSSWRAFPGNVGKPFLKICRSLQIFIQ
jgi:hypothetical protein